MYNQQFTEVRLDVPEVSIEELETRPHEVFSTYRPQVPFIRRPDGVYLMLRAKDMATLYDESKARQLETEYITSRGVSSGPVWELFSNGMLTSNGQTHRSRRSPVARTFSYRMVEELRPRIRETVNAVLDECAAQGSFDLRDDFASKIPAVTIAGVLGLPREDIPHFTSLVYSLARILTGAWQQAELPQIEDAASELMTYTKEQIEKRRRDPGGDFISNYIVAVDEANDLTVLEIIMQLVSLIIGGSDTTRAAIVIQTALLLQHREQWQLLLDEPDYVPNAVAEALRYEPSVGSVTRITTNDLVFDGYLLPRFSIVSMMLASGMRDPELHDEPDRFDIRRAPAKWHPVFGGGPHRCLGEALAKIELEEALRALLDRFPSLTIDSDFPPMTVTGHAGIRRINSVPVKFS
jgi:cytochrome P450 family 103